MNFNYWTIPSNGRKLAKREERVKERNTQRNRSNSEHRQRQQQQQHQTAAAAAAATAAATATNLLTIAMCQTQVDPTYYILIDHTKKSAAETLHGYKKRT